MCGVAIKECHTIYHECTQMLAKVIGKVYRYNYRSLEYEIISL